MSANKKCPQTDPKPFKEMAPYTGMPNMSVNENNKQSFTEVEVASRGYFTELRSSEVNIHD